MSVDHTVEHGSIGLPALVQAARSGDRAAFGELYARFAGMVHSIALANGATADADDVVQEVFFRAFRRLKTLRSCDAFASWIAAIARNTVRDVQRQLHDRSEPAEEPAVAGSQHDELEARAALEAIRRLPKAYRETLMMRLVEGLTGPEIAERAGLSPASVRVNLHRGMKRLREQLRVKTRAR